MSLLRRAARGRPIPLRSIGLPQAHHSADNRCVLKTGQFICSKSGQSYLLPTGDWSHPWRRGPARPSMAGRDSPRECPPDIRKHGESPAERYFG
ncbi:MAG: hypothetical protein ACRER7_05295, partial [Gammaproteobacteria bacterium]